MKQISFLPMHYYEISYAVLQYSASTYLLIYTITCTFILEMYSSFIWYKLWPYSYSYDANGPCREKTKTENPVHYLCSFYIGKSNIFAASVGKPFWVLHSEVSL